MKKIITTLLVTLSIAALMPATGAMAKHGADDPAGHHRHGEGAGHP